MADFVAIYSTFDKEEKALEVARALVERGLAACANILPGVTSVYKWKDKLEVSGELVMIAKTRASLFTRAKDLIVELHDYETPCVVSLDISGGDEKFLGWIEKQTINP